MQLLSPPPPSGSRFGSARYSRRIGIPVSTFHYYGRRRAGKAAAARRSAAKLVRGGSAKTGRRRSQVQRRARLEGSHRRRASGSRLAALSKAARPTDVGSAIWTSRRSRSFCVRPSSIMASTNLPPRSTIGQPGTPPALWRDITEKRPKEPPKQASCTE